MRTGLIRFKAKLFPKTPVLCYLNVKKSKSVKQSQSQEWSKKALNLKKNITHGKSWKAKKRKKIPQNQPFSSVCPNRGAWKDLHWLHPRHCLCSQYPVFSAPPPPVSLCKFRSTTSYRIEANCWFRPNRTVAKCWFGLYNPWRNTTKQFFSSFETFDAYTAYK